MFLYFVLFLLKTEKKKTFLIIVHYVKIIQPEL